VPPASQIFLPFSRRIFSRTDHCELMFLFFLVLRLFILPPNSSNGPLSTLLAGTSSIPRSLSIYIGLKTLLRFPLFAQWRSPHGLALLRRLRHCCPLDAGTFRATDCVNIGRFFGPGSWAFFFRQSASPDPSRRWNCFVPLHLPTFLRPPVSVFHSFSGRQHD